MQPTDPYAPVPPQPQGPVGVPPPQQPYGQVPVQYPPNAPAAPQPHEYEFIVNPQQPTGKIPGSGLNGTVKRALVASGGLLVLLILFSVIKGLLSGGSNLPEFVSVAQDQQQLIHLSTNAAKQKDLNLTNQNFAITAQLSLTSDRTKTIAYLTKNGIKVDAKLVSLKINPNLDTQLTAAAAASTYDQTFKQIMETKLVSYEQALKRTYTSTKGPKGQALLNEQYKAAELLLAQLKEQ